MCNRISQKEICRCVSDFLREQQRWISIALASSAQLEPDDWQGKMEHAWPMMLFCDL